VFTIACLQEVKKVQTYSITSNFLCVVSISTEKTVKDAHAASPFVLSSKKKKKAIDNNKI
jgi:hypothetical protein